jgi:hypothetical protein
MTMLLLVRTFPWHSRATSSRLDSDAVRKLLLCQKQESPLALLVVVPCRRIWRRN